MKACSVLHYPNATAAWSPASIFQQMGSTRQSKVPNLTRCRLIALKCRALSEWNEARELANEEMQNWHVRAQTL